MDCCDPYDLREDAKEINQCPDCGEDVDEDGDSVYGCNYSPVECKTCGWSPCDQSC